MRSIIHADRASNVFVLQIKHEHELNELDETVGDSDCGYTLSSIAKVLLDQIKSGKSVTKCCDNINPYYFVLYPNETQRVTNIRPHWQP